MPHFRGGTVTGLAETTGQTQWHAYVKKYYASNPCRDLIGMERLHLQSLFWPDAVQKKQVASYSHSFLADLVGNAIEGSCMAAKVLFCLLSVFF